MDVSGNKKEVTIQNLETLSGMNVSGKLKKR